MKALNLTIKTILAVTAVAALSSCGTSKSTVNSVEQSSRVEVSAGKPLASCNRADNSNFSVSMANVIDPDGRANLNWVKLKFNFLSTDMTQTGYHIKFYKWRVVNNATQLDPVPLEFNTYSFSNNTTNSNTMNGIFTSEINNQNGLFINLKDDVQTPYQVLKTVIYKTDGTIAAQGNILIPQFLANPEDYKLNPDGSPRASLLQNMHLLYGRDVSTWSTSQIQQYFDQHCF
jgi:hypothetical protein